MHHLLTSGCSAVNGCRQNESPNSWYKHHINPQVIHTTSVHQLLSCEAKSCIFLGNKFIMMTFFILNHCFHLKFQNLSPLSIIWIFLVKKESRLNHERNMHRSNKCKNNPKQFETNMPVDIMWEDIRGWTFTRGGVIKDYGLLVRSNGLHLKHLMITSGLLWCFHQLFGLLLWRHPFTAANPLVSK